MLPELPHAGFPPESPPDREVRQKALDPSRSFAVAAPAGSGKTGLLTQRLLRLLALCDAPEEILAITFTRKAAGEMQDRVMQALWRAEHQPAPTNPHARFTWELARAVLERNKILNWQLLLSPQRLRVQTIDSLCRALTRQMPLGSGLGAQPGTLEDTEPAYRRAVRDFLQLLEEDSPLQQDLARLLLHLDNNIAKVEELLIAMLAKREQWLSYLILSRHESARQWLEQNLQSVIDDHLQELRKVLASYTGEICELADRAAHYLQEEPEQKHRIGKLLGIEALPKASYEELEQWKALADLLLTNSNEWRSRLTKSEGFPSGNKEEHKAHKQAMTQLLADLQANVPEVKELLAEVRLLPAPHYNNDQWQLLESLTHLLPRLTAQLNLVFQQLGATDYTAITQASLTALGEEDEPSDLALQLDYRIRHILVDEFQDTATPQLQLLQKLTAGWQPGDGRTLFIVGDGMQSCYGFRDANVGIFLDARRQGIGHASMEALDLEVNFRSQTGIVDWVNRTFYHAFPGQDDIGRGAVRYSPSIAFHQPLQGAAVNTYVCTYVTQEEHKNDDDEEISEDKKAAQREEAKAVLALIEQSRAEDPDGVIAILVRNRSHLTEVLDCLRAAGLKWQATEIDSLASRMAIKDLHSLTRALLTPDDRIAWLSLLRAPWCGLDLKDLHRLVTSPLPGRENSKPLSSPIWLQIRHHQQIDGISEAGHQCLERLRQVLQPALDNRQRKPLRQWIEGLWVALGGPACLLDASDRDNVQSFLALLDSHQQGGNIRDWVSFNRAIEKLFAKPAANADPRLQVMTIHKSKGLEFDTVIIPGLDRTTRNNDKQLLLWLERLNQQGERQLLLGTLSATGEDKSSTYEYLEYEAKKRERYEATRLLYVGCTRAIKRLHLLACLRSKDGEIQNPNKGSLLASIWPSVKDQLLPPPLADTSSQQAPALLPTTNPLLRLHPQWQRPVFADPSPLKNYRGHEYQDENDNRPKAESRSNRLARHTGTLLHRALQVIVEQQLVDQLNDTAINDYIARQKAFWLLQLRRQGWQSQEQQTAIAKIERGLRLTLQDSHGRWLLDHRHDQSSCELRLCHSDGERLRELSIDRSFVADGLHWIVDYKSSEPLPDQSLDEFIAKEVDSYRSQLQRYREQLGAISQLEIRTALYFPLLEGEKLVEI